MLKKKIVITGASSSIMDAVISLVQLKGNYKIIGITRKIKAKFRNDIEWIEFDLSNTDNDYSILEDTDIIIHAAAISNAYTQQEYLDINYKTTKTLVDNANKYGVKRFVYISSVLACKSCGFYGYSKFMSENYIKSNFDNWLIIRPAQLYGYSEKAPIDSLISKIASKRFIPSPVGDPKGLIPLFYKDAAKLIGEAIFEEELISTTKIITGPQAFNYKALINEISTVLERKVLIFPIPGFVLTGLRNFLVLTGIRIGIFPDQIFRLYNPDKSILAQNREITTLNEYIRRKYKVNLQE